jgi:membrane protein implicated in regulation of membrane protease activity
MQWWTWMILGLVLLCVELFAIDVQFYLVFIGVGALIVGLIQVTGVGLPDWAQWFLFAVLSLVSMFTIRKQLYAKLRGAAVGLAKPGAGDRVKVTELLAPGQSSRTEYRGSQWTAINIGEEAIPSGTDAEIEAIDGVNLRVRLPR